MADNTTQHCVTSMAEVREERAKQAIRAERTAKEEQEHNDAYQAYLELTNSVAAEMR